MNCIFCSFVADPTRCAVLGEDEEVFAFLDIAPASEGHTLIIPKTHEEYLFDTEEFVYELLMVKAQKLAKSLKDALGAWRIDLVVEGYGQPHLHLHLIPQYGAKTYYERVQVPHSELRELASALAPRLRPAFS